MTATYTVPDMSCQHCVDAITTEVGKVDGVTDVTVDLDAKTVSVAGGADAAIVAAIDEAGYDIS
jgi:copper chaperone